MYCKRSNRGKYIQYMHYTIIIEWKRIFDCWNITKPHLPNWYYTQLNHNEDHKFKSDCIYTGRRFVFECVSEFVCICVLSAKKVRERGWCESFVSNVSTWTFAVIEKQITNANWITVDYNDYCYLYSFGVSVCALCSQFVTAHRPKIEMNTQTTIQIDMMKC